MKMVVKLKYGSDVEEVRIDCASTYLLKDGWLLVHLTDGDTRRFREENIIEMTTKNGLGTIADDQYREHWSELWGEPQKGEVRHEVKYGALHRKSPRHKWARNAAEFDTPEEASEFWPGYNIVKYTATFEVLGKIPVSESEQKAS